MSSRIPDSPAPGPAALPSAPRSGRLWVEGVAAAMAALYAALKLYWAFGGDGLKSTIGFSEDLWHDPLFELLGLWGTVLLAALGALIPFALVKPWGAVVPRWMLELPIGIGCAFTVLRGIAGIVQESLYLTGAISSHYPDVTGAEADTVARWSLFLYSPWFLVWGLVLGAIGLRALRTDKAARAARALREAPTG
ncbi:DUF3995 domain-containing protein [Streptomyces sp. Y1]|uniref:DUF3995 domain-containing protein n=1 Tax=Streptomyces sp. Y1 TaxID=3238634 RepID=A0AB39TUX9_9ACTN